LLRDESHLPLAVDVLRALHRTLMMQPASVRSLPTCCLLLDAYIGLTGMPAPARLLSFPADGAPSALLPASASPSALRIAIDSVWQLYAYVYRVHIKPLLVRAQKSAAGSHAAAGLPPTVEPLLHFLQRLLCWCSQHQLLRPVVADVLEPFDAGSSLLLSPEHAYLHLVSAFPTSPSAATHVQRWATTTGAAEAEDSSFVPLTSLLSNPRNGEGILLWYDGPSNDDYLAAAAAALPVTPAAPCWSLLPPEVAAVWKRVNGRPEGVSTPLPEPVADEVAHAPLSSPAAAADDAADAADAATSAPSSPPSSSVASLAAAAAAAVAADVTSSIRALFAANRSAAVSATLASKRTQTAQTKTNKNANKTKTKTRSQTKDTTTIATPTRSTPRVSPGKAASLPRASASVPSAPRLSDGSVPASLPRASSSSSSSVPRREVAGRSTEAPRAGETTTATDARTTRRANTPTRRNEAGVSEDAHAAPLGPFSFAPSSVPSSSSSSPVPLPSLLSAYARACASLSSRGHHRGVVQCADECERYVQKCIDEGGRMRQEEQRTIEEIRSARRHALKQAAAGERTTASKKEGKTNHTKPLDS
jgi:hypothetical protein